MAKLEIGEIAVKNYDKDQIISLATSLLASAKMRLSEAVRQQNLGYVGEAEATVELAYKILSAQEKKTESIQKQPLTV